MGRTAAFVLLACLSVFADQTRPDARVFRGEKLDAVAMPIGGIGTGTVWLAGDGRLSVWQIFNNSDEQPLPDTFMALRVGGEKSALRVLQRGDGWGLPGFTDVACIGEYPFLRIDYRDPALPIAVELEGFNPMIPTNTKDSSLPCAIFRLTATNLGTAPVDASFLFSLLNPIGYAGGARLTDRRFSGFGGNRNTFQALPEGGAMTLALPNTASPRVDKGFSLAVLNRNDRALTTCTGVTLVPFTRDGAVKADALWLEGLTGGEPAHVWQSFAATARDGGTVLVSGAELSFFKLLESLSEGARPAFDYTVFEDFESGSYEGWKIEGAAFGAAPHTGTTSGQQHVSGFAGKRFVNTYVPNDGPQGRATSKPFKIAARFIGFLVGGGSHAGKTCINLVVDGAVVRTQTGRDNERLEPAQWDVSDLRGKEATLQIVDAESGPWGHINVDHIIFSDSPPTAILAPAAGLADAAALIEARILDSRQVRLDAVLPFPGAPELGSWRVGDAVAVMAGDSFGFDLLLEHQGTPLIATGPLGKGRVIVALAKNLPAAWGLALLAEARGGAYTHGEGIAADSRVRGDCALSAMGGKVSACARWTDAEALMQDFGDDGLLSGPADSGESPAGETFNGALACAFTLKGGERGTATFVLSWHFPNVERFGHRGNRYAGWFADAAEANAYVRANFARLDADTRLYHATMYATNLPYLAVDAITSQTVILRGPTCWWALKHKATGTDYFAGYEGCYGCCPLNCTHVWNYAQSHARLFPEIGRNLRWYDFIHYLRPDGETQHRQHSPHGAFIDGHCAVIEGAYREYLMSPDRSFLRTIYPGVRKAVEWLIKRIDPDEDGVNGGVQWNTYDVATNGAHTFLGSQYLSALAAGEAMALVMDDPDSAARWRKIREAGSAAQDARLWNGEYWIQIPDPQPARDYNTGCHSDQILGQWWSHMLDTGYLYPPERVKTALKSIFTHNFRTSFEGFRQLPRRYVLDDESGLLMCSWPKGGRPNPFILYADEVWTGIEYAVAGLMIYEGMIDEALAIITAARDRYDGRTRHGLNSGPGGNPFNELECGKFYARAMSSWSILLASQGFIYEGPVGRLGFKPRWKPEDHASFFCAAAGWGLFTQTRAEGRQTDTIECRWGTIPLRELVFAAPAGAKTPTVLLNGAPLGHDGTRAGDELRLRLREATLKKGDKLTVEIPY
ncbi:MAG TPA: GH116 family glycosyl hydrolase [Planctomycetota bacterium]|jgi:uncharacterized protein (DUF608 family)|nr:hypothetical protein [Planctomycetota bacterium]OQC21018.1 MAG: hypothetical protein BWX69_01214 [Planctomycetes bacterium ADurb.Bin069]HNR99408.1 GH116 family glycosyl hydrolase [Planctomycetota bacterium]HNU25948.1 GH116 family glycosyl hydrolase [Planctomycetota bacterium]HOE30313.1 GH116 family glycosyl hydrolase [Planctomycetota bacterium]